MFYILDTDHISLLQRGNLNIREKLANIGANGEFATTIISQTEQFLGWWAAINRTKNETEIAQMFRRLQASFAFFSTIPILPYDEAAAAEFVQLRSQKVRIGTQDLRIASIALSRNATVVTRNLRDFQKVQGLLVEDWSQ